MSHPALAEPDGKSHRGGEMVAADIDDSRVLSELSRRFRQTSQDRFSEDFEKRQEYLLRLLDYYWFSKPRIIGMTGPAAWRVFGPFVVYEGEAHISGGRDLFILYFENGRVKGAQYVMGY